MPGKTTKTMTRGLQLSYGGPKCPSALSDISWRFWEVPEEGPGLHKGQHPQPDQVQEDYVREAEVNQHAHQDSGSHSIQEEGMTRYQYCCVLYPYQPSKDTFDTVYSSFHKICVRPAKTFGGHCSWYPELALPGIYPFFHALLRFGCIYRFAQPQSHLSVEQCRPPSHTSCTCTIYFASAMMEKPPGPICPKTLLWPPELLKTSWLAATPFWSWLMGFRLQTFLAWGLLFFSPWATCKRTAVPYQGRLLQDRTCLLMQVLFSFEAPIDLFFKVHIILSACPLKVWPPVGTRCRSMPFFPAQSRTLL